MRKYMVLFSKGLEQYEEKSKPNLEETEIVNNGTETEVKETFE